jgi:Cu/Ag efflux protein CusF
MILNPLHPLRLAVPSVLLTICISAEPALSDPSARADPFSIDFGGLSITSSAISSVMKPDEGRERAANRRGELRLAHDGRQDAHATGTVNTVDPAQRKLNISHNPIPEIGWPAMTMDFAVAPTLDLRSIKPGTRVDFTIEQGAEGMYVIRSIAPARASQR